MLKNVCPLPLKANTYYGCSHGCKYCYVNVITKTRTERNCKPIPLDYMRRTFQRAKSSKGIGEIHKSIRKGWAVLLGALSDPFPQQEMIYKNTYKFLKYLNLIKYPCVILTKSDLCVNSEYINLYSNCHVVMSIASLDKKFSKGLEPNAPLPKKRLKALEKLVDEGVKCTLSITPLIWGVNDNDTERLIEKASDIGVVDVTCEYLRLYFKQHFQDRINEGLGFDLKESSRGDLITENSYYMLKEEIRYERLGRIKSECELNGLKFYSVNSPILSNWKSCYGEQTHQVNNKCLLMNGYKLKDSSVHEYLNDLDYPFYRDFERQFHRGYFEKIFYDLEYDTKEMIYKTRMK